MKKLLMALAIASVFAACKSDSKTDLETNKIIMSDTTGAYPANASSDTGTAVQRGERPLPASNTAAETRNESPKSTSASSTKTETTNRTTTKKKGWSSRAKGAVIGGAAGAVGGAIISKHKGTGAVVGGVGGAAAGYIIGNEIDRKKNR
ncbi:MAG: glycine zipper domain-containing protein [Bacteroidota bacterium]|nr:glycine zipper domain-containing protein [Bacteroidota bacterium]